MKNIIIEFSSYIPNGSEYEVNDYLDFQVSDLTLKQLKEIEEYGDDLNDRDFWFLDENESKEELNKIIDKIEKIVYKNCKLDYIEFSIDKIKIGEK